MYLHFKNKFIISESSFGDFFYMVLSSPPPQDPLMSYQCNIRLKSQQPKEIYSDHRHNSLIYQSVYCNKTYRLSYKIKKENKRRTGKRNNLYKEISSSSYYHVTSWYIYRT